MYLLDTDILSNLMKRSPSNRAKRKGWGHEGSQPWRCLGSMD